MSKIFQYPYSQCLRVVDGDTIDAYLDYGMKCYTKQRFRLSRINAPETRTTDPKEKRAGQKATDFLKNMIEGKQVFIETSKSGKYGRYLAEVFVYMGEDDEGHPIKGENLNDMLVDEGLAEYTSY